MARAQVNGVELWYELKGSGPYLVQIGGAVSAHEGYVTITEAMTEHFTVIDYDHRGYGQSDRPHVDERCPVGAHGPSAARVEDPSDDEFEYPARS